jgi:protoporphyrinogen oxidase
MRIGVIGAGFTALSASIKLQEHGHEVTLFEKEKTPGGLAVGFKGKNWEWSLEEHYHHIFTSDTFIRNLAKKTGHTFIFKRPNTSTLIDGDILQLDSPLKLLEFSKLSYYQRFRMGAVLGYLKYAANWESLEKYTAHKWLQEAMGKEPYSILWEPMLKSKFGNYYKDISLAWFWARIKARTPSLGYPEGGFQAFADTLASTIKNRKGIVHYETTVTNIETKKSGVEITYLNNGKKEAEVFDKVLVTVPNILFAAMGHTLPKEYINTLRSFESIGAVNMVLEMDKPFFKENVYWLSICEKDYPFVAVVEHTNFIEKSHYNNKYLLYIGNYLPHTHKYFKFSEKELLKEFDPYLSKLNPDYKKNILNTYIFRAPYAQPIVPPNFSEKILPFQTPMENVYLANMQQVYPWDRGTNFAVEIGERVVDFIL